ncbi:hypothetical protein NUM_43810 [Actinocatenispora comari]|uniref:Uncharacterized protein n=2 Tax=Actinocatenispora comari TaxID=2807577 RepID=A0A8J4AGA1_9ACTN|nr:hypothetical protein NUM_43810 [Actinocatenispora comari]
MSTRTISLDRDPYALNDIMKFDHPIRSTGDSAVREYLPGVYAPVASMNTDSDGQVLAEHELDMLAELRSQGWEALTGWSGQHGYNGPIMHPSELVCGALAEYILSTPGTYVAVAVETEDQDDPAGWLVLRHIETAVKESK